MENLLFKSAAAEGNKRLGAGNKIGHSIYGFAARFLFSVFFHEARLVTVCS